MHSKLEMMWFSWEINQILVSQLSFDSRVVKYSKTQEFPDEPHNNDLIAFIRNTTGQERRIKISMSPVQPYYTKDIR